jgi:hypothetical protein
MKKLNVDLNTDVCEFCMSEQAMHAKVPPVHETLQIRIARQLLHQAQHFCVVVIAVGRGIVAARYE